MTINQFESDTDSYSQSDEAWPSAGLAQEDLSDDISDLINGDDEADGQEADAASGAKPAKSAATRAATRALIRRVAVKNEELAAASGADKSLLAELLGTTTDTTDLTVAVMTSTRSSLAVVSDLRSVADPVRDGDAMEAILAAIELEGARLRAVWSLLAYFGTVTGKAPASGPKAGKQIVKAVQAVSEKQLADLDRAVELAKR